MIERILYLDGIPKITIHFFNKSGQTPKEQISFLLKMESKGVSTYYTPIAICIIIRMQEAETLWHAWLQVPREAVWGEDQLDLIKMVVPENYLLQCVGDPK